VYPQRTIRFIAVNFQLVSVAVVDFINRAARLVGYAVLIAKFFGKDGVDEPFQPDGSGFLGPGGKWYKEK
jgi:hypothetical protein